MIECPVCDMTWESHEQAANNCEQCKAMNRGEEPMTPCEEYGLSEGQWVWFEGIQNESRAPQWVQLERDDFSDLPFFDSENGTRNWCLELRRHIDWSQGIHNEKPSWTPREYGGEGPPRDVTNSPHQMRHGDYILREDIPDEATFDAIVAECERRGIQPASKDERNFGSEGSAFLLRGSIDLCQWSDRPWHSGRRITPADLGITTPETDAISDPQFEAGSEGPMKHANFRLCGAEDMEEDDPVNSPDHYAYGDIECIDALRAQCTREEFEGHLKCCAAKYLWRWKQKGGVEDLRKASWYIDRLIVEQQ